MKNPIRHPDSFSRPQRACANAGGEIPRRDPHLVCPASFQQEWIWQREQAEPGRATYHLPAAFRLIGALDLGCLEKCLHSLEERHEVLRTRLSLVNGRLIQVVKPAEAQPLSLTDLTGLPKAEREAEASRLASMEVRRPFDVNTGPLWRATIIRLAPDDHLFVFTAHELILDHGSLSGLFAELSQLYRFFLGQPIAPPAEPRIHFADYAVWQRRRPADKAGGSVDSFEEQMRNGFSPALELPMARPPRGRASERSAQQFLPLPVPLAAAIKELAGREQATPFVILLAAWQTLLHRFTGRTDIGVSTPVSGREPPGTENVIGPLAHLLALRGDLRGDPPFRELIARTRQMCLDAFARPQLLMARIIAESCRVREAGPPAFGQVQFALDSDPAPMLTLPGVQAIRLEVETQAAKADLALKLSETGAGLQWELGYQADLFEASAMTRLLLHFQTLLQGIVDDPSARLSELPLLSELERHDLLVRWNDTAAAFPRHVCMHTLFEEQAAQSPDAVALVFGHQRVTYRELNARANQLAHLLRSRGVGPEVLVGVWLERSIEMIVALLGILKAGGAYVPLAIDWPLERLTDILDSLKLKHLLAHPALLSRLPPPASQLPGLTELIGFVDVRAPSWAGTGPKDRKFFGRADLKSLPRENPPALATSANTAYVIHTSGSSGTPKGVVVRHESVVNVIDWVNRTFAIGPRDRLLFVTSVCFDLSVYDIFGPLAAGASVQVASETECREPASLLRLLQTQPITFWDSAPAFFQQLTALSTGAPPNHAANLRLVFLSGDWIPITLPDQIRVAFPGAQVVSLGGATEATVWSNYYPVGPVDPAWCSIPYGRPIQNAQYYVLDERLQPCPIGLPGQLYIGGVCLASGYANDPALTAAKFIRHPFSADANARLYATGDVARHGPDGNLELLGRRDQQVKPRGYRIELGEIESALRSHPSVAAGVVVAREESAGEKRLVAYVAFKDAGVAAEELQSHLQRKLPDYMVPALFVELPTLPLTANGKVDREALPSPLCLAGDGADGALVPANPLEARMAEIWATVLRLERVGLHTNFFELGGDSILAARIVARVRDTLQVDVPVRALFETPTVAGLAAAITRLIANEVANLSEDQALTYCRGSAVNGDPRAA